MTTNVIKTTIIERGIRTKSMSPVRNVKEQLHAFVDNSHIEKLELGKLNCQMNTYLSRVKALESDNSKLMRDIFEMQSTWGDGTRRVRDQHENNLFDLRARIDDVAHLKTIADIRTKRAGYEKDQNEYLMVDILHTSESSKEKLHSLERKLNNLIQTNHDLKEAFTHEANDIENMKRNRDNIWSNLMVTLDQLDNEMMKRIAVEYNNQTLREHIEFVKQINEREVLEVEELSKILPFNEQMEFYKDQLKRVVSGIRRDYSNINAEQTREIEEWMTKKKEELCMLYTEKDPLTDMKLSMQLETAGSLSDSIDLNNREINELRKQHELKIKCLHKLEEHLELDRLHLNDFLDEKKDETTRLNESLTNLLNDYNHLNSNKTTLEYELQVYKRLLEANTN